MLYLMCFLFPPLACLAAGRLFATVLNGLICCTIVGIPLAWLHAWCVVKSSYREHQRVYVVEGRRRRR